LVAVADLAGGRSTPVVLTVGSSVVIMRSYLPVVTSVGSTMSEGGVGLRNNVAGGYLSPLLRRSHSNKLLAT